MGREIHLKSQDGTLVPAWLAEPQGPVRGSVIVAQEIFGVNDHIRKVTERFAARGFWALAPQLFARISPDVQLGYDADSMLKGKSLKAAAEALPGEGVLQDIRAAAQWLQHQAGLPVGIVGFCWGGLLAWRAAERVTELSAAVCYYGGGMTAPLEAGRLPRCPVLAHFGRKDVWIPVPEVLAFSQVQPAVQVHLYDADHGFNCDQRGSFDQISAMQAKDRTLAFFDLHLQSSTGRIEN